MRNSLQVLLAAILGMAAGAPGLRAQSLVMAARQGLAFGQLVPGVARTVPPTDAVNRGELALSGTGKVNLTFSLPSVMAGPTGANLPLIFAAADGLVLQSTGTVAFDPRTGTTVNLHGSHDSATIGIGGTAQPSPGQAAGVYTATIVVYVIP